MTEERWRHIYEVFLAALEQPATERTSYLDLACDGDVELRREVQSLLEASAEKGPFDRLAERFDVGGADADPIARHVGPFHLLRELGRGGMGIVYLAVREDDQLARPVALKVFHPGPHRNDHVERFLAERQILARLDHPHIARLLSGGVTEPLPGAPDGQPYFAMEYVDGEPITDYCDTRALGIDDRLKLFLDACEAVQHAHRHLVIHRDIKPSNILVAEDGAVKLLDFGIAKLLDEAQTVSNVPLTRSGLRLMTPEYASPEQVRGEAVTTATDVYQLGVLLYELLTGRTPFRLPSRLVHDVERIICDEPPDKPSTAVAHSDEDVNSNRTSPGNGRLSEVRATTTERLRRRLTGDLDTIVLTAMRKEPERRYSSAEALADDIRRHLDGLPVRARPDTLSYRTAKFVRRHRFGVMASGLLALVVTGFAIAMAVQAQRVTRERDRAEEATAFMVELFQDFEPVRAQGSTVMTRDLLDRRSARIRTDLRGQPLLQARLLDALGQIYRLRGHYPEAESLFREALALRLDHLDARHLDVADSQYHLGLLLSEKDAYMEAERHLQSALAIYRSALGGDDLRTALVLEELAIVHRTRGDLGEAEERLRELVDSYRTSPRDVDTGLATALLFLGKVLLEQGRFEESEPFLREALSIQRRLYGEHHPAVANALDGLGELAHAQSDYTVAEGYYRDAYAIRQRLYEKGHSDFSASLTNLGIVLHDRGRYEEAEPLLREALAIARAAFGEQHGLVTDALFYLGSIEAVQENWARADSFLSASLATWSPHWTNVEHHMKTRTYELLNRVRSK